MKGLKRNSATDKSPKPFIFSPSQFWDGNDGRWSTFILRAGTPEQNFRILPSTSGHETFIPVPEGCTASDPDDCGRSRGAMEFDGKQSNGFLANASTTWKPVGLYTLDLGEKLGIKGNGVYGLESVGLMLQNSGGLKLDAQVVAGIATKDFYLGLFGLGPKPSNFTDFDNPQPAFIRNLKDRNEIPSVSFGYTAGAAYRIPQLPGSLTLGGYDASRFTPNDQTFSFSTDDSRILTIGIQRITASSTLLGSRSFLSSPTLTLIDSTFPHIWLPKESCDQIAEAFGLIYDNNTDFYLVNDTIHDKLRNLQPIVTFYLGNDKNVAKAVTIQMPYSAFDLQVSHPYYQNATNYFPIRRATNDTQYTLGRVFLQEAYVIADYERSNFSIHQSKFESNIPEQQIIAINTPLKNENSTDGNGNGLPNSNSPNSTGSGISKEAKAGIGAGVGALVCILLMTVVFWYMRRKKTLRESEKPEAVAKKQEDLQEMSQDAEMYELYHSHCELPGGTIDAELPDVPVVALLSDDAAVEHPFRRPELSTESPRQEMEGEQWKGAMNSERSDIARHEM